MNKEDGYIYIYNTAPVCSTHFVLLLLLLCVRMKNNGCFVTHSNKLERRKKSIQFKGNVSVKLQNGFFHVMFTYAIYGLLK